MEDSKTPAELLKAVQVDKLSGAKSLEIPKIDTFSDLNSDLNFLANAKKTFPPGQFPKNIKNTSTSPLRNEVSPEQAASNPKSHDDEGHLSSEGFGGGLGDANLLNDSDSVGSHSDLSHASKKSDHHPNKKTLPAKPLPKPMTDEEIRREKAFLLFQYESKNKDFRYSKAHLTMNSSLDDIKNEIELINSKRAMESNMSFWRRGMVLCSEGLVYLNNTFDPFSVEMSDWSKQMAYEVMEEKSYDELLEELVLKYKSTGISAPVEIRLALAVGASFGFGVMAKKRENAILEKLQTQPPRDVRSQPPHPFYHPQQHTHGPSMNADDVIKMMQETHGSDGGSDLDSDRKSEANSMVTPSKPMSDDQSVITIPSSAIQKKRGRKPKAKEPETILKL